MSVCLCVCLSVCLFAYSSETTVSFDLKVGIPMHLTLADVMVYFLWPWLCFQGHWVTKTDILASNGHKVNYGTGESCRFHCLHTTSVRISTRMESDMGGRLQRAVIGAHKERAPLVLCYSAQRDRERNASCCHAQLLMTSRSSVVVESTGCRLWWL